MNFGAKAYVISEILKPSIKRIAVRIRRGERPAGEKSCRFAELFKRNTTKILVGDSLKISVPRATIPAFPRWHAEFGEGGGGTKGLLRPFVIVSVVVP